MINKVVEQVKETASSVAPALGFASESSSNAGNGGNGSDRGNEL